MRRRNRSDVGSVLIRRVLKTATAAGMRIASLEVGPDGSILVGAEPTATGGEDMFDRWASRP